VLHLESLQFFAQFPVVVVHFPLEVFVNYAHYDLPGVGS